MNKQNKYGDIISLPHHISCGRKRMSLYDRAAQFSPFAALTGHGEALSETARLTDSKPELDESEKMIINEKLQMILRTIPSEIKASITYFAPDDKKSGGAYLTVIGQIMKYNVFGKKIVMSDETEISIENIVGIDL